MKWIYLNKTIKFNVTENNRNWISENYSVICRWINKSLLTDKNSLKIILKSEWLFIWIWSENKKRLVTCIFKLHVILYFCILKSHITNINI